MISTSSGYSSYRSVAYFSSLDGLRTLSILAVIWYHVPELRPIWSTGFLGHLFFVISGFLITTLLLREKSNTGTISLKKFYIRRTLRIFPAYYLTLAIFLLFCLTVTELRRDGLGTYLHNLPSFLTYTSNWFVYPWGPGKVIFVAAWSLATEEQFYLFWPGIVARSKTWYGPVSLMLVLIAANEVVKLHLGYIFFLSGQSLPITIINSVSTAICLGCLLAYALHYERTFRLAWRLLGQRWSAPLWTAVMLVCCLIPNNNELHVFRMFYCCLSMTLVVGACTVRGDNGMGRLFSNRVAAYLGAISYGMYLFHPFGINIVDRFLAGTKEIPLLQFLAVTSVTVAIASLSYWTFERYFLKLKARFGTQRRVDSPHSIASEKGVARPAGDMAFGE